MSRTKMVVMKDWLDQVEKRASQEQKYELYYKLLRYGIYEEYERAFHLMVKKAKNVLDFEGRKGSKEIEEI